MDFPFESSNNKAIDTFYSQIKRKLIYNKSLSVSKDNYNEDYVFIVIHGIRDLKEIEVLKIELSLIKKTCKLR